MHDFFDELPHFYPEAMTNTISFLKMARISLIEAQKFLLAENNKKSDFNPFFVKERIDIRFASTPYSLQTYIVGLSDISPDNINRLGLYKGTVIKCTQTKSLEKKKVFFCVECGAEYETEAEIQSDNSFRLPPGCENMVFKQKKGGFFSNLMQSFHQNKNHANLPKKPQDNFKKRKELCNATHWEERPESTVHVDYQEIKIQEQFETIKPGKIPSTMWVSLENSLVDKCSPGDDVVILGVPTPRIKKTRIKERPDAQLILVANTVTLRNGETKKRKENRELGGSEGVQDWSQKYQKMFEHYWKEENRTLSYEIETRSNLIESLCPHLYEKYDIKLAMLLVIVGGVTSVVNNTRIRGQSHLLIIGEPGTGKSQILRAAHELSFRAVYTNGIGSTSAGLTVSLSKEGSEWMIEAGALVIADLGICCIDEFNLIKNSDYKAVHEAMEQQTVSMSKAGLCCKVNTRASILAACNPVTPGQKYNTNMDYVENSGLTSPLISRFDIVFVMTDKHSEFDSQAAHFVLNGYKAQKKRSQLLSSLSFASTPGKISISNSRMSIPAVKEIWSVEVIREYIRHVQTTIRPIIEDDADRVIREYFKYLRTIEVYGKKTIRTLESIVRLTQAHARIMHRQLCNVFDAVSVIVLMEAASSTGLIENPEHFVNLKTEEEYLEVEEKVLRGLGLSYQNEE